MIKITIHTNNDAFYGEDKELEVARILRELADRVENGEPGTMRLRDVNGNNIGEYREIKGD